MKGTTKFVVGGGIATAVLGPATVGAVLVSVIYGTGQFINLLANDGAEAAQSGVQTDIPPVQPMFGGPIEPPLTTAPSGPNNAG